MTQSIIEESKQAKQRGVLGLLKNKKFIVSGVIILIVFSSLYFFINSDDPKNIEIKKKEWTVKQDDIKISIESDGKVVAEDGVELSFSVSGSTLEVEEVFIEEGDEIKKGDKIASVKTENLSFNVRTAWASYQSALANYNDIIDGPTDQKIKDAKITIEQAEISLEQAKISLEKTKTSVKDKIADAEGDLKTAKENFEKNKDIISSEDVKDGYEELIDTIKSVSITLNNVLPESDEIIGVDNEYANDNYEKNLAVKDSDSLTLAINSYNVAKSEKEDLDSYVSSLSINIPYSEIDMVAEKAIKALEEIEDHLFDMQDMLENTITSSDLTQTALDAFKSTINTNRTSVNTKITTLNDDIQAVENEKENIKDYKTAYENALADLEKEKKDGEQDIKNAEANVATKEISLEQKKDDYNELLAPLTDSEYASARSSLTSAAVNLERAQYELEKAVLASPIDGEVALLNYKTGDIIMSDENIPVVSIINNDTLFIEVNIEEADINKIKVGQKAYATFDALDGLVLEGEISFISLTSKTSNNGIVTYLVRVVFENTEEAQVREGMTAFVDFVISEANNVLIAPVAAVRNIDGKPSVELISGEWVPVITGFTDGDNVEIISGLNSGDIILY